MHAMSAMKIATNINNTILIHIIIEAQFGKAQCLKIARYTWLWCSKAGTHSNAAGELAGYIAI